MLCKTFVLKNKEIKETADEAIGFVRSLTNLP